MSDTEYKALLEKAKADLLETQRGIGDCLKKQEQLEKRALGLRETVVALSRMLNEEFVEEDALGLTDAIRQAFKARMGESLTPVELKGVVESLGFDISNYGNFMASVHSVIKRLVDKGEITKVGERADGKPAYGWMKPFYGAPVFFKQPK